MNYASLKTIISEVMVGMGLVVPSSNLFTSNDGTVRTMRMLLSEVVEELIDKYDFQAMITSYGFTTQEDVLTYELPDDWKSALPNTEWCVTTQWPLVGPLAPDRYRELKTSMIGVSTLNHPYAIRGDLITFVDNPGVVDMVIDYISYNFILTLNAGELTPVSAFVSEDDLVRLPKRLVKQALRTRWRENKGFDVTRDLLRLRSAIEDAKYNDTPPNTINLLGTTMPTPNLPDTGWGQP